MIFWLLLFGVLAWISSGTFKQMGPYPSGKRLEKLEKSAHYRDGAFHNIETTPELAEGYTQYEAMKHFFFEKDKEVVPKEPLPSQKTELLKLDPKEDVLVWFGHSSYFLQIEGVRFLIDPVFSGHASPFSWLVKSFKGTDVYTDKDIPNIDYLLLTHDHYDHTDLETLQALIAKTKRVVTGLGVGEALEKWGFKPENIQELDWNQTIQLEKEWPLTYVTARHFSGRGFKRNRTLWGSFVLKTSRRNLFLGGDSGYGKHFAEIGKAYGPFDLAILENGQYNKRWRYIHLLPEETLKAAQDLGAKHLFPVHNSKFPLSTHAWMTPMRDIKELNKKFNIPLVTPMIGEKVLLDQLDQGFLAWWEQK